MIKGVEEYFVYSDWKDDDVHASMARFSTLEGAKSWMLKRVKEAEMILIKGKQLFFKYEEEIKITEEEK